MPLRASVRAVGRFSVASARLDRGSWEAGSLGAVVASGEATKGAGSPGRSCPARGHAGNERGALGQGEALRDPRSASVGLGLFTMQGRFAWQEGLCAGGPPCLVRGSASRLSQGLDSGATL